VALSLAVLTGSIVPAAHAGEVPWSHRTADAAMTRWPDGADTLLAGMDAEWLNSVDLRTFNYIKNSVDRIVGADGSIDTTRAQGKQIDDGLLGRELLRLYGVTQDKHYYLAATGLYLWITRQQSSGTGALPQARYGDQAFIAEYAAKFHHPEVFGGITARLVQMNGQGAVPANELGWAMAALVDTLPFYGEYDSGRETLLALLKRDAEQATKMQSAQSGLWDATDAKGKAQDRSAPCFMVYALAKAVRLGYLPQHYRVNAERGYKGMAGESTLAGNAQAVGAFLLASTEMENAQNAKLGRGQKVVVDAWFNSQMHADPTGQEIYFHYKWDDQSNNGYSLLGHIFANFGAELGTLYVAPTAANLRDAKVYIIASPDIPAKNPHPNYVQAEDGAELVAWVKSGGVLVLLANDPANTDLDGLNRIADRFGMHFNSVLRKHVLEDRYELGKIAVVGGGAIFHDSHTLFMKDVCTITTSAPAVSALSEQGETLMATANYGRGAVFATVDPWIYNEYTDGRKLPALYDNYAGGDELVRWILGQIPRATADGVGTRPSAAPRR
jgi:unsaturated rhamnogalacturonyl hydrolase